MTPCLLRRVGADSVVRVCARVRGRMQPATGGFGGGGFGGDSGQWTCTNLQCRVNRCWPTKSKCFRCGSPKGYGLTQDPGRPPYPPPGWQAREQHHLGRPAQTSTGIAPTMSKKAAKAERKEAAAAAASGFPHPCPSYQVRALELLKGGLDGELFFGASNSAPKPKVVPPKKKEDALLRKRIEKDKAKDQQAKQIGNVCLPSRVSGKLCMIRLGRKRMKRLSNSSLKVIFDRWYGDH